MEGIRKYSGMSSTMTTVSVNGTRSHRKRPPKKSHVDKNTKGGQHVSEQDRLNLDHEAQALKETLEMFNVALLLYKGIRRIPESLEGPVAEVERILRDLRR